MAKAAGAEAATSAVVGKIPKRQRGSEGVGKGVIASERERKRVSGAAQDIFQGGYLLSSFLFI